MAKYSITDFSKGDQVHHLSNTKLKMVVVEIVTEENEISCRWVDDKGQIQCEEFMPEELGKSDDLRRRIKSITAL